MTELCCGALELPIPPRGRVWGGGGGCWWFAVEAGISLCVCRVCGVVRSGLRLTPSRLTAGLPGSPERYRTARRGVWCSMSGRRLRIALL